MLVAGLLCGYSTLAQKKNEAPANAKANFSKSYPTATKVKWEKEHGKYEVSFMQNGKEMSVLYNASGAVEETETKIAVSDLPAKSKTYAMSKGRIKEAAKIVTSDGRVKYEAEVNGKDLIFDEKGNFYEESAEVDEGKN